MTLVQSLKATFTRGEATPLAHARSDAEFFKSSAASLRNYMVLKYGGVTRRPGFKYRGAVKNSAHNVRLIPFEFSTNQVFVLEFGDQYIRFWTPDGARVLNGGSTYEISTTYAHGDLDRLQFVQSNDVIYIVHPDYPPRKLSRFANTNWTIADVSFTDGPWLPINDTENAITLSAAITAAGETPTFTFDDTTNINRGAGLSSDDVGRLIRMQFNGVWWYGAITAVATSTTGTITVTGQPPVATASSDTDSIESGGTSGNLGGTGSSTTETISWRLGLNYTDNYPGSVSFFEGRLAFGRWDSNPNAIAFSMSGIPETFSTSDPDGTVTDSHGMTVDINNGGEILWLQEAPRLQIGFPKNIRTLGAADSTGVLTPRNVRQRVEVNYGTTDLMPTRVGPSTVHAGRYGKSIHDLIYDYNTNALIAPELSTLSEHFFKSEVIALAYAQEPDGVLWAVTSDGSLIGTTFEREERVIGFHKHPLTNGAVKSIVAVPNDTSGRDVIFAVIERTINSATVKYVETMEARFDGDLMDKEDAFFVDCGATYSGAAANTVTGLHHLEGETVSILADGAVYPSQTVVSGEISLPNGATASKWQIGLPILSTGEILRPVPQKNNGSTHGDEQRAVQVFVDEYETLGLEVGTLDGRYELVRKRQTSTPMGQSDPLHTGVVKVSLEDSHENEGRIAFRSTQPLPATIRALNVVVEI